MACVAFDAAGVLSVIMPQPLVPDAENCPLVVETFNSLSSGLWSITPDQGGQIGTAVLLVWAVGFTFRLFIQALKVGDSNVEANS